jgi:lysophospholipase L1-like esterase
LCFQRRGDTGLAARKKALRIIAHGGSTTFSYNVPMDDTWPAQLERLLRTSGAVDTEVLNAGDVMWSLGHALTRAKRELPKLRPDYVIIYSGINEGANYWRLKLNDGIDLGRKLAASKRGIINNDLMKASFLFRNSVVFKLFHHRVVR